MAKTKHKLPIKGLHGDIDIDYAYRKAPFVVVPGHNGHHGVVDHAGLIRGKDQAFPGVIEVNRRFGIGVIG